MELLSLCFYIEDIGATDLILGIRITTQEKNDLSIPYSSLNIESMARKYNSLACRLASTFIDPSIQLVRMIIDCISLLEMVKCSLN